MNPLRLRFDRPGSYTVLRLQYCGMGHHRFITFLLVGAVLYIWETGRRCLKAFSAA